MCLFYLSMDVCPVFENVIFDLWPLRNMSAFSLLVVDLVGNLLIGFDILELIRF